MSSPLKKKLSLTECLRAGIKPAVAVAGFYQFKPNKGGE